MAVVAVVTNGDEWWLVVAVWLVVASGGCGG